MSTKPKILLHLDCDPQPSMFDRVVAIDAGVEQLFSYGGVTQEQVQGLIHGCIFTRGPKDLSHTAVFIGGSNVALAEQLLSEAQKYLLPKFGLCVSLMLDPNGSNTTAAAAVRCAGRHLDLGQTRSAVLGTGPVGQRAALLLARHGGMVCLVSRQESKARAICDLIQERLPEARLEPVGQAGSSDLSRALENCDLLINAGAAGVAMAFAAQVIAHPSLKVLIDTNAVPPAGIEGVEPHDNGATRHNQIVYGALGVGGLKMKIHKSALTSLFTSNSLVLDVQAIYDLSATC